MSLPRERELKVFFPDQRAFARALSAPELGEFCRRREFTSTYFDTSDLRLARDRAVVRLRSEVGRAAAVLCVKVGREAAAGFFDSIELESELDAQRAESLRATPSLLYSLQVPAVQLLKERYERLSVEEIGSMTTARTEKLMGGLRLEFDRVSFAENGEIFELEVEVSSSLEAASVAAQLQATFAKLGLAWQPQRHTKLEQLLARRTRK